MGEHHLLNDVFIFQFKLTMGAKISLRNLGYKIYSTIQSFIVPELKHSQQIYESVFESYVNNNILWLDIGCGHRLLPEWRFEKEKLLTKNCLKIVGLDYDFDSLNKHRTIKNKVRADIQNLPFADNSFDLVTANMVVEHLSEPLLAFKEINRILKPGGIFLFHTPNVWGYTTMLSRLIPDVIKGKIVYFLDGRKEEDVFPAHYRVNSVRTIKDIAHGSMFKVESMKMIVTTGQLAMVPCLVVFELLWIKCLMTRYLKRFRTNIIGILKAVKD